MKTKQNYNSTITASCFASMTQAVVNNLAPLLFLIFQKEFGLSLGQITTLTTVNFAIQLTVDALSVKFVDKIGYRASIVLAHVTAAVGLLGMTAFPFLFSNGFIGLLVAAVFYAVGGGLIEVVVSPIVEACPSEHKESVMSFMHSFYSWGSVAVIVLSSAFLAVFGKSAWRILPILWAILPIANGIVFTRVPINRLTEEGEEMSLGALFKNKMFWLFMVIMVGAGASELGMSQWASAFAESALHVDKMVGDLLGPCFFAIMMGIARVLYAKIGPKVDLRYFLTGSAILCVFAYLLSAFVQNPIIAFLGCGICGFSVGVMWPGTYSLAAKRLPKGGTAMFALLALGGDMGCTSGPTAIGWLSEFLGGDLKKGLAFAAIFPFILLLGSLFLLIGKKKQ